MAPQSQPSPRSTSPSPTLDADPPPAPRSRVVVMPHTTYPTRPLAGLIDSVGAVGSVVRDAPCLAWVRRPAGLRGWVGTDPIGLGPESESESERVAS
jgi:hypothetical protein